MYFIVGPKALKTVLKSDWLHTSNTKSSSVFYVRKLLCASDFICYEICAMQYIMLMG